VRGPPAVRCIRYAFARWCFSKMSAAWLLPFEGA